MIFNKVVMGNRITDLEFKTIDQKNLEVRMQGCDVTIDRCVIEQVWAITERGAHIRANRIDAIEGLSVVLTPPPIRRLRAPGTDIPGCLYIDTVAGRYRYVIDRWYDSAADREADPIDDDTIDLAAAAHLAWVTYNYDQALEPKRKEVVRDE